jgi:hypothetical protein
MGKKREVFTCAACDYEQVKPTGALPETAACHRCGADLPELAQLIEDARTSQGPEDGMTVPVVAQEQEQLPDTGGGASPAIFKTPHGETDAAAS